MSLVQRLDLALNASTPLQVDDGITRGEKNIAGADHVRATEEHDVSPAVWAPLSERISIGSPLNSKTFRSVNVSVGVAPGGTSAPGPVIREIESHTNLRRNRCRRYDNNGNKQQRPPKRSHAI